MLNLEHSAPSLYKQVYSLDDETRSLWFKLHVALQRLYLQQDTDHPGARTSLLAAGAQESFLAWWGDLFTQVVSSESQVQAQVV